MDIFTVGETKLDSSFSESQILLPEMRKPFRLDVTNRKGGLLVYVDNDIPSKYLQSFHLPGDLQAIPLEIKSKTGQATEVSIYRPPDQNLDFFVFHYRFH